MYSLIIAEPIGVTIGLIAGRAGANLGKKIAHDNGIPLFVGAMLGSFIAHYVTSAMVKALINAGLLDLPGGMTNVAFTSPLAAGGHGVLEGVFELIPELGETINQAIREELPSLVKEVAHTIDFEQPHFASGEVRFGQSYQPLEIIADIQNGPTCGFETIENMVQAANIQMGNNFSEQLLSQLAAHGVDVTKGLPMDYYQSILGAHHITSQWLPFDHQAIINNLIQPGGTVAIAGDPYYIRNTITTTGQLSNIPYANGGATHAITLTDIKVNEFNQVTAYVGVDSNTDKPLLFSPDQIEKMVKSCSKLGKYSGWILLAMPM